MKGRGQYQLKKIIAMKESKLFPVLCSLLISQKGIFLLPSALCLRLMIFILKSAVFVWRQPVLLRREKAAQFLLASELSFRPLLFQAILRLN